MEGLLVPKGDPSSLDALHILRNLQSLGFCSDIDHKSDGSCFEHILSVFLKDLRCKMQVPPFPARLGDGKPMDLYKLYRLVSDRGGYDSVTANKSWAVIAEGIGLGSALGCPVKLVYAKYLITLERCLQRVPVKHSADGSYLESQHNLGIMMSDSENDVRSLLPEILKQKKDGTDLTLSPCSKRVHLLAPPRKETLLLSENFASDRRNDSTNVWPNLENGSLSSLKRKRDLLVGMLNWVKCLAKNPVEPFMGKILPSDGLKVVKNMVGEQYSCALEARKALFLKRIHNVSIDASNLQIEQRKHPTIDDACNGVTAHSSDHPSHSGSCSKPSMACSGEKDVGPTDNANDSNHLRRTPRNSTSLPDFLDDWVPIRIPIGSSFQAKVPRWTRNRTATSNDSGDRRWLGGRVWPPANRENPPADPEMIGKGREDGCNCTNPGSVECVRFHVAESRLQLKRELGSAFYAWRFHSMGEEVALSWKEEEEQILNATFHVNHQAVSKSIWQQLRSCCPLKGHRNLASYYFNVFLLALRSYQNRVSPNNIDSDDEETGLGFLTCTFSYGEERFRGARSIICAQNLQCVDLAD